MSEQKIKKKKLSKDELSRIRSIAGRKGGATRHKNAKGRFPTKTISVRAPDYDALSAFANFRQVSISEAFHRLCAVWMRDHQDVAPEGWNKYLQDFPVDDEE